MQDVWLHAPKMLRVIKRLKQHNLYALGIIQQPEDLTECEASGFIPTITGTPSPCPTPTELGLLYKNWAMIDFDRTVHGNQEGSMDYCINNKFNYENWWDNRLANLYEYVEDENFRVS